MNPPAWAEQLMLKTLDYWEAQGNKTPSLSLEWRHRTGVYSTGTSWRGENRIRVRQGAKRLDTKLVLLHEMAHQLVEAKTGNVFEGHSLAFWEVAWQLYQHAGLSAKYCLWRESKQQGNTNGYVGAQMAYERMK